MLVNQAFFRQQSSIKGKFLKVSPNGRYLTFDDGKPFFYLADTAWTLFKRLNHEEVDIYLQNRICKGFNVIQAYVLRGLKVRNLYGHTPLIDGDPAKPNEAFYENIDYIINRANELGVVIGGVVTWGEHVIGIEQIFNEENAFAHGKFLGKRYKDNCVVWYLGGDRDPIDKMKVWASMAKGLKEGSEGRHLVSYHGPGKVGELPSSSVWFHQEDWLDFNVLQTGHGWTVNNYDFITHDYNLKPVKPVLDMEASYENHPDVRNNTGKRIDAHQVRESMYWQVLAGAAGHGYGCNDIWCFWDETLLSKWEDYAFPSDLKQNTHWRVAMDFQGAISVGIARRLFELRPWYMMVPDQSVIASGQQEGAGHIQAARAEDGSFIIAYLPQGGRVGIHMDKISGMNVKAQWYNPRDGRFIYIGQYAREGVAEFTAPSDFDRDDWVLVLEDEQKEYPCDLTV